MDTFREPTPEEIKFATLAFMGQHLTGELKELEKNMVSKNRTCTGATINPVQVLRTIPADQTPAVQHPNYNNPMANVVNAGINLAPKPEIAHVQIQQPPSIAPTLTNAEIAEITVILKRIEEKLDNILQKP